MPPVSEVFINPDEEVAALSRAYAEGHVMSYDKAIAGVHTFGKFREMTQKVVDIQTEKCTGRMTTEQWLDENANEWYHLDTMLRSRPWAKNKDTPFEYPFKDVTDAMRKVEGPWLRDSDTLAPNFTSFERECEVLTHVRSPPFYPPGRRVILFTPEFGSDKSYDKDAWNALQPEDDCDIWICSWQGWASFDEMMAQVCRKMLSFADAVSTIWYGHSGGALVAYELLKKFEEYYTPNLPVALVVSGCPAPSLFSKTYKPEVMFPWMKKLRHTCDLDNLTAADLQELQQQFQVINFGGLSVEQRKRILGDYRILSRYSFKQKEKKLLLPVLAMATDTDPLVDADSVKAWSEHSAEGFEFVSVDDYTEAHGYAFRPDEEILRKINEWGGKYKLEKRIEELLKKPMCDVGPTDGPVPEKVDFCVVGSGIAGVHATADAFENGFNVVCLDRYDGIGGIWNYYANKYSQVNSSEVGYRMVTHRGPTARPNKDHSPKHDILRDIHCVAAKAKGCYRLKKDVTKVDKQADGTFIVHSTCLITGQTFQTHATMVCFAVNRRIGKRRNVVYPNEDKFNGVIRYGYANEVLGLNFWGKRVMVVGAGAFAFENLRTSLEHGAKHATILGRRAGTTSPKWIDIIAYIRPLDALFNTNKVANALSFECWRKCYTDANIPTPECWDEGLLKPHNHTVSVSDLAFVGGHHGMVTLAVGEIKAFHPHGQNVILIDGREMEIDIVIKSTGFLLNEEVPIMCGHQKMYPWGQLDFNLFYQAEPLLDGGQFGSIKGQTGDDTGELDFSTDVWIKGAAKLRELGLPDILSFQANPFGSGYVGGMLTSTYQMTWLLQNPEAQKMMIEASGAPVSQCTKLWASSIGTGQLVIIQRLIKSLVENSPAIDSS